MPRRDYCAVVFVIKGGRAEVNQQDVWVPDHKVLTPFLRVVADLVLVVDEEHILRFKVCVCEPHRV